MPARARRGGEGGSYLRSKRACCDCARAVSEREASGSAGDTRVLSGCSRGCYWLPAGQCLCHRPASSHRRFRRLHERTSPLASTLPKRSSSSACPACTAASAFSNSSSTASAARSASFAVSTARQPAAPCAPTAAASAQPSVGGRHSMGRGTAPPPGPAHLPTNASPEPHHHRHRNHHHTHKHTHTHTCDPHPRCSPLPARAVPCGTTRPVQRHGAAQPRAHAHVRARAGGHVPKPIGSYGNRARSEQMHFDETQASY